MSASDPPKAAPFAEYDQLARRYLELWQGEMARLAHDPAAAGVWGNLFKNMMQSASPVAHAVWPGATPSAGGPAPTSDQQGQSDDRQRAGPTSAAPTGAAPAAAPLGDGGLALADVFRRLDAVERRLAALESHPPPRRRKTKPKP